MNDRNSKPKLEPLEWRHAHDLQRVVNDPTMTEWSNMPHAYFSNGAQSLIQRSLHQARNEGNHMLALYIEDDLSGVFSIQRDSVVSDKGHLLFWVEANCWKSGRSIAYLTDVVGFAMKQLGLSQLFTTCLERNTICTRALEDVGFQRFGRQRSCSLSGDSDDTELRLFVQAEQGI
ncbi:MAG: GNAT family N-acetyltransferase [Verrucomicrobia bacterium]|nr:GNAT family N-acetyltransferase [Verrucomicrobiota bacterium]MDA1065531.1 GNAT family N-acetyltransferase [Verrucomicrobiota bacterium]